MSIPAERLRRLLPASFAVAFTLAIALCARLEYITNDNVTIADFAAHGYAVRYVGIFFTGLVHLFYSAFPGPGWFGIALCLLDALALALWLTLLWRVCRSGWLATALSFVICGFFLRYLVYLDYTSTSVLLCMAALCWACTDVLERKSGWLRYLLIGAVFALGMWARPHGGWGALVYGLPIVLWVAWLSLRGRPWAPESRRLAFITLLFLTPAILNLAADSAWRAYTMTPQQAAYDDFNAVRGKLHRLPRDSKYALMDDQTLLASIQWTPRDLSHLFNWSFLDERKYTPAALQTLLDGAPSPRITASDVTDELMPRISPINPFFLLMLAPLPLLLAGLKQGVRPLGWGLLLPLYGLALTVSMVLTFSFLFRIEYPFAATFGLSSLIIAMLASAQLAPGTSAWQKTAQAFSLLLALAGGAIAAYGTLDNYQPYAQRSEHLEDKLQMLDQAHAGYTILIQSGPGLTLEMLSPFQEPRLAFQPIQLGWSTFSPRFYQQLGSLKVQHAYEMIDAITADDHALALGSEGWCRSLKDFASKSEQVQVVSVQRFRDGTVLCRMQRSDTGR